MRVEELVGHAYEDATAATSSSRLQNIWMRMLPGRYLSCRKRARVRVGTEILACKERGQTRSGKTALPW